MGSRAGVRKVLSNPSVLTDKDSNLIGVTAGALDMREAAPVEYSWDEGAFQPPGQSTVAGASATTILPNEIDGSLYLGFTPILMVDRTGASGTSTIKVAFECLRVDGTSSEWAPLTNADGSLLEYGGYSDTDATANYFTLPWVSVCAHRIRAKVTESGGTACTVSLYAERRP